MSDQESDKKSGFQMIYEAANEGCKKACYLMGTFYEKGVLVQTDEAKAKEFYTEAIRHTVCPKPDKTEKSKIYHAALTEFKNSKDDLEDHIQIFESDGDVKTHREAGSRSL